MSINYILCDIEGTTSSIRFVHKVLFPYAQAHLGDYVETHAGDREVQECLESTRATLLEEKRSASPEDCIKALLHWIDTDRKHPALKRLQGLIWEEGYRNGNFSSHLYPDVITAFERWEVQGIGIGIYSSGSVHAQQLLFEHTEYGDIRSFFSDYFDTGVGHKREVDSYQNIQQELGIPAEEILFLSDVEEELDAAHKAGFQTLHILREGARSEGNRHRCETDFSGIE